MVIYVVGILYLFTAEIGSWNIHCELALVSWIPLMDFFWLDGFVSMIRHLAWEAEVAGAFGCKAANSHLGKAELSVQPVLSYVNEGLETSANWKIKELHPLARSNKAKW